MPGEIDRVFYHHGGDLSGSVEIRLVMAYPQINTDSRHVVMQGKSLGVLVFPALAAGKP
jgi:hypothetical protein